MRALENPSMPRARPFTQADIEKRNAFGLGPRSAAPDFENTTRVSARHTWRFADAIKILKIKEHAKRRRCREELTFICKLYFLDKMAESQETPARKAQAFQHEKRWKKRRSFLWAQLKCSHIDGKRAQFILGRIRDVQLPMALEQEAWRQQAMTHGSLKKSYVSLQKKYARMSKRGRPQSYALTHLIQRLQALASGFCSSLTWCERNMPKELVSFIVSVLEEVKIDYVKFDDNPSKFRRLFIRPVWTNRSQKPLSDLLWDFPVSIPVQIHVTDSNQVSEAANQLRQAWINATDPDEERRLFRAWVRATPPYAST
jgi:hypothetical protein